MKKFLYTDDFIKDIPKTDLHLHLDGSLRIDSLIEMAKKCNIKIPSYTTAGLEDMVFKEKYASLVEYLQCFAYTCSVLRDLENLERAAYELAKDNQQEGVCYIEVRYAPQLLINGKNIGMKEALEAVNNGLLRAKKEYNSDKQRTGPRFNYGIIVCAMRFFAKDNYSPYYSALYDIHQFSSPTDVIKIGALELARAAVYFRDKYAIPIVGLDLAGQEDGHPSSDFKDAYDYAHKNFMHKTVHAGEAYGAESIFQAITDLHADRLGHGYYLFDTKKILDPSITEKERYIEQLSSYISDRRITIEVCLTSNLQTNPNLKDVSVHSFGKMLSTRMAATFCTDNRLVSRTSVSNEIKLALKHFSFTPKTLKDYIAYGFKKNFYFGPYVDKRKYAKEAMIYYDKMVQKHMLNVDD